MATLEQFTQFFQEKAEEAVLLDNEGRASLAMLVATVYLDALCSRVARRLKIVAKPAERDSLVLERLAPHAPHARTISVLLLALHAKQRGLAVGERLLRPRWPTDPNELPRAYLDKTWEELCLEDGEVATTLEAVRRAYTYPGVIRLLARDRLVHDGIVHKSMHGFVASDEVRYIRKADDAGESTLSLGIGIEIVASWIRFLADGYQSWCLDPARRDGRDPGSPTFERGAEAAFDGVWNSALKI